MLIDKIVAKSPYDKNDPISCQDAEVFVKTIANNLENWIKVQTGHPTAVCCDPVSFIARPLIFIYVALLRSSRCETTTV